MKFKPPGSPLGPDACAGDKQAGTMALWCNFCHESRLSGWNNHEAERAHAMTDDTGDGWRNDLRRVLSAWVYILAAAILSVAAWATGAATGYAVILFCLLFLLVVFRQLPVEAFLEKYG